MQCPFFSTCLFEAVSQTSLRYAMGEKVNILITAIGKRVQLIEHLKKSFRVIGTDVSTLNPARYFVDQFEILPKYSEEGYIHRLIDICKKNSVSMIIPLYEKEFNKLNQNKDAFEQCGTKLLLSSTEIINICNNKWNTAEFFKNKNINTPTTFQLPNMEGMKFPAVLKPFDGMGSQGVHIVANEKELQFFLEYAPSSMVQELVTGREFTVDVLCDFNGTLISIVPRERLEIRAGEVVKSRIIRDTQIIEKTKELVLQLQQEGTVVGPLTIQCFLTEDNEIKFIEINPRFGGGVPLTLEAGIDYGMYLEKMIKGEGIEPFSGKFKELTMLRYEQAVYLSENNPT